MLKNLVVVGGEDAKVAGILVFWSLCGVVDLQDLVEQCESEGIDPGLYPAPPTTEVIASRALDSCARSESSRNARRLMVRPLGRRGAWDLVEEQITKAGGKEKLNYSELVRVQIDRGDEGERTINIEAHSPDHQHLVKAIEEAIPTQKGIMNANDVSAWLLTMLVRYVHAVSMRERGGFYFVPRDQVEKWHQVVRCIRSVSDHKMFEIPAIQSDEAVNAIIDAVKKEAETAMTALETYLMEDVSTRGLNAWDRDFRVLKDKVDRYSSLLGVQLDDLNSRAQILTGALTAMKIKKGLIDDESAD